LDSLTKDVPAARRVCAVALTGLTLAMAGCATPPANDPAAIEAYKRANDPIEPFNRHMLEVNLVLDNAVLKPIAYVYKETLPQFSQDAVDAFLHNLRTPVILANDLMQGDGDRAWTTFVRFAANSTFGLGGLIDVAADMGYPAHDEDFGQTLAVWGIEDGPYLMLPLFGPSNPRDAVGRLVDTLIDPLSYVAPSSWQIGQFAAEAVDDRAKNYDATSTPLCAASIASAAPMKSATVCRPRTRRAAPRL
jgi:phospholipid-binding lipoprotein MlaA